MVRTGMCGLQGEALGGCSLLFLPRPLSPPSPPRPGPRARRPRAGATARRPWPYSGSRGGEGQSQTCLEAKVVPRCSLGRDLWLSLCLKWAFHVADSCGKWKIMLCCANTSQHCCIKQDGKWCLGLKKSTEETMQHSLYLFLVIKNVFLKC